MSKLSHPEIQSIVSEYDGSDRIVDDFYDAWGRRITDDPAISDWSDSQSESFGDEGPLGHLSDTWPW